MSIDFEKDVSDLEIPETFNTTEEAEAAARLIGVRRRGMELANEIDRLEGDKAIIQRVIDQLTLEYETNDKLMR